MAPASKPDIEEVARTLAALGGSSIEQLTPSIEADEVTKRYVKEIRPIEDCDGEVEI